MDRIEWNESFSLGIENIDGQHKQLFKLTNLLFETMETTSCTPMIEPVFRGLMTYARTHFAAEETLMRQVGFPHLTAHQTEHLTLTHKACEMISYLKAENRNAGLGLARFLKNWLIRHIRDEDSRYGAFIQQQQSVSQKS